MSLVTDWSDRALRFTVVLEIDGLAERFCSDVDPGIVSPYLARGGLLVGSGGTTLDGGRFSVKDMLPSGGGATVRIADTGPVSEGGNGAAETLLRMGQRGASAATRLAADVASQAPGAPLASLTVDSNTGFAASGYLWVGQECMSYTGLSGGTGFAGLTRGALGSQASAHFLVDTGGFAPLVTSECVSFRGRRARLRAYIVRDDGSAANPVDLVAGFVEQAPRIEADGVTVTVVLAPDTARLANKLPGYGVAQEARLARGVHVFTDGIAGTVGGALVLPRGAGLDISEVWVSAGAGGQGSIEIAPEDVDRARAVFDPTFAAGDVRRGVLDVSNTSGLSEINSITKTTDPAARNSIYTAGTWAAAQYRRGKNPELKDFIASTFHDGSTSPEVLAWPSAMLDQVRSDWSPGTHSSPNGRWADVRFEGGGATLVCVPNIPAESLEVSINGGVTDESGVADTNIIAGIQPQAPGQPAMLEPSSLSFEPGSDAGGVAQFSIAGVALAFYQNGERRITLDDDVIGGVLPATIEMLGLHPSGRQVRQSVGVSAVSSHAAPDGRTVYSYTLTEYTAQVRFEDGDWRPYRWPVSVIDMGDPVVVRPLVALEAVTMPVAVGQILASAHGDNVRGFYDVLHDGLGLDTSQFDQSSVVAAGNGPPGLQTIVTRFDRDDPKEVGEVIGPMVRTFGTGVTQGVDRLTGARLVRLVQVVRPSPARSVDSFAASDFTAASAVESMVDDELVNALTLKWSDEHPGVELRDGDSIPRHGGEAQTQDDELSGLAVSADVVDLRSVFLPIATRRFALLAEERRVFRGTIPLGRAMLLALGDVVTLTHPDVLAYTGARGLTDGACIVTAIDPDVAGGHADVELTYYGARVGGFAPALRVTATPAADEITVGANVYTLEREPLTGQTVSDLDFFEVGDTVLLRPAALPGGWPTGYTRTITDIDRTTRVVRLSAAHGLAVGDRVRSPSYSSSSEQVMSHFGDTSTREVVAGVALYEHE